MEPLADISKDFAQWYQDVVYKSELADQSPVKGCMVIRPYGYALWENIKAILDKKIKDTGHQNAAFPLLIPLSFLQKEAEHVQGFAPEIAVVTHAGGKELEEPYVIRPTSETIIHYMFARWIKSWRDLPLKINQWSNVIRWEMRTRPFLRTSEFFWQEGHTAHETEQEAHDEAVMMLNEYVDLARNYLAIPVVPGIKSESEKFAGADKTYTFEGVMQDGKALQMGTSHLISQNFAKAFGMQFQDRNGQLSYPYLTSWGATTRLVGAVVMVHGDQKGLVLPPKVAPIQVVIIPIFKTPEQKEQVLGHAQQIMHGLTNLGIRVHLDDRSEVTPGAKFWDWELKGVPLRMEIGPRDIENKQVVLVDRLRAHKETVHFDKLSARIPEYLEYIQALMLERAEHRRIQLWHKEAKVEFFGPKLLEHNGIYQSGWCGKRACEEILKQQYKATIRCLLPEQTFQTCFACDDASISDVMIGKAY